MLNAWGGAVFDSLMRWLPECAKLPQRANLFEDVREAMPRHDGLFVASDAGPVTDPEGNRCE